MDRWRGFPGPFVAFAFFGVLMMGPGGFPWWVLFPLFFIVVLPFLKTMQKRLAERPPRPAVDRPNRKKLSPAEKEAQDEKAVLIVARDTGGVVTPATVALQSSLTIQQAETILQRFVSQGHATVEVTDQGMVEYRFPEFYRPDEPLE